MTMTLVFSMGCVLVPLPDYTESCKRAVVFIWLFFCVLDGAKSHLVCLSCPAVCGFNSGMAGWI